MQKTAKSILIIESVVFLLFTLTSFFQWELFAQTSYQTVHLTKTDWSFVVIRVQDFSYDLTTGTIAPNSGVVTYLNYPYLIMWFFLPLNLILIASILRSKESKPH